MRRISLAAIAALAMLAAPAAAQQQQAEEPARVTLLNVTASGVSTAPPDMATISLGVTTQAATPGEALAENTRRMTALLRALRQAGLAERDIQTDFVRVNPNYDSHSGRERVVVGYEASNGVRAEVHNISRTGRIIDAAVAAGGNTVQGISFSHEDREAQLNSARRDAMRMARARADLYAESAGLSVWRIRSITESGATGGVEQLQLTATLSTDSLLNELPQILPVEPGEVTTRANVNVAFELR